MARVVVYTTSYCERCAAAKDLLRSKRVFFEEIDCTGDFDLVCCGHSHEARIDRVDNIRGGTTTLVNPGTVAGIGAPATFAIGDLTTMHFQVSFTPSTHP